MDSERLQERGERSASREDLKEFSTRDMYGAMSKQRKRTPQRAVTLGDVDRFLDSPVARRYFAFSDSNVKRHIIRLLLFLREEVERLEQHPAERKKADLKPYEMPLWVERLGKRPRR